MSLVSFAPRFLLASAGLRATDDVVRTHADHGVMAQAMVV